MTELSALVLGLGKSCSIKYNFRGIDLDDLFAKLDATDKSLQAHPLISPLFYYTDIDDPADVEKLHDVIRAGDPARPGKPWDVICIGFGVRGNPALSTQFEDVVNYCKETAPAAKLTFSATPSDHLQIFARHYPYLLEEQ